MVTLNKLATRSEGWRGKVLVADDDAVSRQVLAQMLRREGFTVVEAQDGAQALALFMVEQPTFDLVFMDAIMPRMDGFEATRQLKNLHGFEFVPVIFQSALQDEASLVHGIAVGGDDFLTKPYNFALLRARLVAMERVRDLQRDAAAATVPLALLLESEQQELELAERIFSRAIKSRNVATEVLGMLLRPAAMFSGDVILTQQLPDGGLRVLLGDFTGHGLAAALAALPVADAFHVMTRKGVDDQEIVAELNRKLYQLLPVERFMAVCLISVPGNRQTLRWWNGGLPSAWLRQADGLHELESYALPLGIVPELPETATPRHVSLQESDRLLMFSDGLLEAQNCAGTEFQNAGFHTVLAHWQHGSAVLTDMIEALDAHCLDMEQADDIAVVEVPLNSGLFTTALRVNEQAVTSGGWKWAIELHDEQLGDLRSVETMLRPLGLLDGLDAHLVALETIVAELYSNALEHGILQLPSTLKSAPDGFELYYGRRADSLNAGCKGWIHVELCYTPLDTGGQISIRFRDSGTGFNASTWQAADPNTVLAAARPWGRGIALVRQLCVALNYHDEGRVVEAIYQW